MITDTLPTYVCTGAVFDVHFTVIDTSFLQDSFIIELSAPTGVFFVPPLIVGSGTGSPITVSIPTMPTGNLYRLRILSVNAPCRPAQSPSFWIVDISGITFSCAALPEVSPSGTVQLIANVTGLFILPYELKLRIDPGDGSPALVDSNLGFPYIYTHTYPAPGVYVAHLTLEYPAPGCRAECQVTVYVPRLSIDSLSDTTICAGESVSVQYSEMYFPPGTVLEAQVLDTIGNAVLSVSGSSPLVLYVPPSIPSGEYMIRIQTNTTPPVFSDTMQLTIINLSSLSCDATPLPQLPDHPISLSIRGNHLPPATLEVEIDFGDGLPPFQDTIGSLPWTITHTYSQNGDYSILVTVRHRESGCIGRCTTIAQVRGAGLYALGTGAEKLCGGDSFRVAYAMLGIQLAPTNLIIAEVKDRNGQTLLNCTTSTSARQGWILCAIPPGVRPDTYTVALSSTDPPYTSNPLPLIVMASPVAQFSCISPICTGEAVSFQSQSSGAEYIEWDFGDGQRISEPSPIRRFQTPGIYPVTLIARAGSCSDSLTCFVEVLPRPQADFLIEPDTLYLPAQTTPRLINQSSDAISYLWDFGDGRIATDREPTLTYTQAGTYRLRLIAYSAEGCRDTAYRTLAVVETTLPALPDFFSPNGDGINDQLRIPYIGMRWIQLTIMDRWGSLLYQTGSHAEWGMLEWDGSTTRGSAVEGTYFLLIEGETLDGRRLRKTSTITLLR